MFEAIILRLATVDDLPALRELIPLSVRGLSQGFYTARQIESAIRHVFGPDTQLIADGTYFVAESAGSLLGCGGWSRRRKLFGGDQIDEPAFAPVDDLLDPTTEAARVRAFFVHPDWARRGIGSRLMQACLDAASTAGFRQLSLGATLPGVPLYLAWGFVEVGPLLTTLPDGTEIAFVEMSFKIGGSTPA